MRKISLQLVLVLTAVALCTGLWMGHGYAASSAAAPGSDQDPLVTKSYVDEALAKLAADLENIKPPTEPGEQPNNPGEPNSTPTLSVVSVAAGGRLIAAEGTEFILRSGTATVIGSAAGGIPDLTVGKDLANRTSVPANHLLLFPRSDGRGIKATSSIIVMVRGDYTIEP